MHGCDALGATSWGGKRAGCGSASLSTCPAVGRLGILVHALCGPAGPSLDGWLDDQPCVRRYHLVRVDQHQRRTASMAGAGPGCSSVEHDRVGSSRSGPKHASPAAVASSQAWTWAVSTVSGGRWAVGKASPRAADRRRHTVASCVKNGLHGGSPRPGSSQSTDRRGRLLDLTSEGERTPYSAERAALHETAGSQRGPWNSFRS